MCPQLLSMPSEWGHPQPHPRASLQRHAGKCYYQLGLLRDAERQFKSSLKNQEMIVTFLELGKVYMKLDQPLAALEIYQKGVEVHPEDTHLLLAIARIHDMLNDMDNAVLYYKKTLQVVPIPVHREPHSLRGAKGRRLRAQQPYQYFSPPPWLYGGCSPDVYGQLSASSVAWARTNGSLQITGNLIEYHVNQFIVPPSMSIDQGHGAQLSYRGGEMRNRRNLEWEILAQQGCANLCHGFQSHVSRCHC